MAILNESSWQDGLVGYGRLPSMRCLGSPVHGESVTEVTESDDQSECQTGGSIHIGVCRFVWTFVCVNYSTDCAIVSEN